MTFQKGPSRRFSAVWWRGAIRLLACLFVGLLIMAVVFDKYFFWRKLTSTEEYFGANAPSEFKCGLPKECPGDEFAFYLKSGIANILGPRICFEGKIIMSGVMNNIKRGMNIVLVNGGTGKVEKFESFDMYSGNVEDLLVFLKEIRKETLVLVASFDDASTILTDEVRNIFANLGSKEIETLGFRDAWVFAGAHTIQGNSIYEKILKNNETNNKYNGWPDLVDLGDCFPKNL
ncbi:protein FAM3D-like isoform X2 [Denticeps clupeoides]|uniref:protein FAM3D-like isoform X2 n=1 Tax=Denticeps clupeoides TaxID=299321 RepID=UPI0010A2D414|nr:protein FAM3D-like isoform X2 [Denticeps clupeoides]